MVQAIAIIQNEHRGLAAVLSCLSSVVRDIEDRSLEPDFELFHAIVDYIESFLDRFHHPKEDDFLFDRLRRRHPEAADLLEELEDEHRCGEVLTGELKAALEAYENEGEAAFQPFREAVETYHAFERSHMGKEERDVLPLARRYLAAEDWREIDEAFTANDDPLFGDSPTDRYRKLFSAIASRAPAPYGLGQRRTREPDARRGTLGRA